jgi:Mn2+/Fe2+ NRAMP family transporter
VEAAITLNVALNMPHIIYISKILKKKKKKKKKKEIKKERWSTFFRG